VVIEKSTPAITISPLYDKLLARRIAAEDRAGLIYIPETAKEKPNFGTVVAIGNGIPQTDGTLRPLTVQSGDKIAWQQWAGFDIEIGGESYCVLSEQDVIGIVKEAHNG